LNAHINVALVDTPVATWTTEMLRWGKMLLLFHTVFNTDYGMAQAFCSWLISTEAHIQSQASPCGIFDGQRNNGTGFFQSNSVFAGTLVV
jgi:hypothetical protein